MINSHSSVELRRIRWWLGVFIIGLILSGITAFPLQTELSLLSRVAHRFAASLPEGLVSWISQIDRALIDVGERYPFLAYGTDWLAFAHLVIAAAFVGPWRDPVRNRFIIDWGLFCCAAIIPLAMIAGHFRSIPFWWRLIDCSFGVFGAIPLLVIRRSIENLSKLHQIA